VCGNITVKPSFITATEAFNIAVRRINGTHTNHTKNKTRTLNKWRSVALHKDFLPAWLENGNHSEQAGFLKNGGKCKNFPHLIQAIL